MKKVFGLLVLVLALAVAMQPGTLDIVFRITGDKIAHAVGALVIIGAVFFYGLHKLGLFEFRFPDEGGDDGDLR